MDRSLPDMGSWDSVFDETYLQTYLPSVDAEATKAEALGAAALAGLEPGAEVLDCPTGFARHAIALADAGYRVTGLSLSDAQTAYARDRLVRLGLGDRVEFRIQDYRDERGVYDGVVSIEMFDRHGATIFGAIAQKVERYAR